MSNVSGESEMTLTESETTGTVGNSPHGSRETPVTSAFFMEADRSEKARGHKSDMHVAGESHSSIVPGKPANKGGVALPAELVEERELTKENTGQSLLDRTQSRNSDGTPFVARSRGLLGVRVAAQQRAVCTSTSKVRTVCGSSARTDLCGGRSAMTVPTAIVVSPVMQRVRSVPSVAKKISDTFSVVFVLRLVEGDDLVEKVSSLLLAFYC